IKAKTKSNTRPPRLKYCNNHCKYCLKNQERINDKLVFNYYFPPPEQNKDIEEKTKGPNLEDLKGESQQFKVNREEYTENLNFEISDF
ncbi:MAG: hypothetical protein ACRC42_01640, partial [Mycoplasma sp.]